MRGPPPQWNPPPPPSLRNESTSPDSRKYVHRLYQVQVRDRASPWDDETRQMLVQNPETGSFYVPAGSDAYTHIDASKESEKYCSSATQALETIQKIFLAVDVNDQTTSNLANFYRGTKSTVRTDEWYKWIYEKKAIDIYYLKRISKKVSQTAKNSHLYLRIVVRIRLRLMCHLCFCLFKRR
uniref:Uncharacterized protein n=1 Tax=Parascaris equorum TaxID=6256 RepID=A0A914RLG2_PAREQ